MMLSARRCWQMEEALSVRHVGVEFTADMKSVTGTGFHPPSPYHHDDVRHSRASGFGFQVQIADFFRAGAC
eukprot:2613500-Rhodomonas_salina.3